VRRVRDGGIVKLYSLTDTAESGRMPVEKLVKAGEAFCSFRTAGVTRRYAALGANKDFDCIIRVWNCIELPGGAEYAILEDGKQYRIDNAEKIYDSDALDLTLVRLEDFYDVADETTGTVQPVHNTTDV